MKLFPCLMTHLLSKENAWLSSHRKQFFITSSYISNLRLDVVMFYFNNRNLPGKAKGSFYMCLPINLPLCSLYSLYRQKKKNHHFESTHQKSFFQNTSYLGGEIKRWITQRTLVFFLLSVHYREIYRPKKHNL